MAKSKQKESRKCIFCGKPDNSSRLSTIDGTICNDCYMHRLEEIVEYLRKNWKKEEPK